MGKSELPNKIEFDRIVEEAFSSGEYHSFSEQYRQKKVNIQRGMIMKKMNNKSERIFVGAVAAAVLAVVAVPTGVVIKNSLEPKNTVPGTDENAVVVEVPEDETDPMAAVEAETEIIEAPTEIAEESTEADEPFKTYEFGWLPEGMSVDPDGWKIHDEERLACITPVLYKISPEQELLPHANFKTGSMDEYGLDGRCVTIFTSCLFRTVQENFFGRNVWITFEGSKYAVFLYVSDALDDNDLAQIIENISLVDTDEEKGSVYVEPSNAEQQAEPTTVVAEEPVASITRDDLTLYSIGDLTVDEVDLGDGRVRSMNVSVNDAYITDNFNGLTTDCIGLDIDFSEFTDENGKIIDAVTEYFDVVEQPDGNYIREEKGSDSEASKILVVVLTYTNNSDFQDDYCVSPSLMTIANGTLERIEWEEYQLEDFSSLCNLDKLDSERNSAFSLYADSNKGSKNGLVLNPGESAEVRLAFLLREDEVGNLYLNLSSYGLEGSTLVDLCNIEER